MTRSILIERRQRFARRALLVSLSTVLCSGLALPALAQSPHPNLDANGVDLTDGSFNLRLPVASIGYGQSALSLVAYSGQTDNWTQVYAIQNLVGSNYIVNVWIGDRYDNFTVSPGGSATSNSGTGATLSLSSASEMVYSALDGTTITFAGDPNDDGTRNANLCSSVNSSNCTLLANTITGRSGLTVTYNWDIHVNCSAFMNSDGSFNCNDTWRLAGIQNSAGYSINWSFVTNTVASHSNPSASWYQRTSAALVNGATAAATVTYANPSSGVYTITTPGGKTWRITGSGASITGVRRPSASSDTTTVSYSGGVVSSVTKDGVTTGYSRSVSGSTATMVATDPLGHTTTVVSNMGIFRPTSVTNALGKVTSLSYDGVGRPTQITYPEGNQVQYGYDGRGNLTTVTRVAKPGSGLASIVTSAAYPSSCTDASCNEPSSTTDALGNETDYAYDGSTGLVTTVTSPAGANGVRPQTRYSYTTVSGTSVVTGVSTCRTGSAPSCVGTADEVKATTAYNSNLSPTSVSIGAGDGSLTATTAITYDLVGNALTVDGPLPGSDDTTTYRWSADRERLGTISPDPDGAGALKRRAIRTSFNADGQVSQVERGTVTGTGDSDWAAFSSLQAIASTYDANARKTRDAFSAGGTTYSVTQYSYDSIGRPLCTAVRMNASVFGSLPGDACTAGTAGGDGPDRITKVTQYDAVNRATQVTSAYGTSAASAEAASYSDNGLQASATDANNNTTSYGHDGVDRLVTTTYPGGSYEQLSLDGGGRITSRRLRDGQSIAYGYDALGRLTSKTRPDHYVFWETDLAYAWDNLGHLTTANDGNGHALGFVYDALGRLTSQSDAWYGTGNASFQYDLAGRRTRQTWWDGFYATYDYDTVGEMTGIHEDGGTLLASFGYDDLGRRTSLGRANGSSTTYGYDNASRLTSLSLNGGNQPNGYTFGYNAAGQITSRTSSNDAYAWTAAVNADRSYGVNALNQLTSAGGTALGYDGRGNLTSSGSSSFGYTSENQLATTPGTALGYDSLGRLFNVTSDQGLNTTLSYEGDRVLTEINQNTGAVLRRYVYGPNQDEPLVWYEGSGTSDRRFLSADERGSVVEVTDGSANAIAVNSYDEFGIPGTGNQGRFQYTGQKWLPAAGLYDYKARAYSPTLGRFMQTDPVGYAAGMNWYNYVGSDPVNATDPMGLQECGSDGEGCPPVVVTGARISSPNQVVDIPRTIASGGGWTQSAALLNAMDQPQQDPAGTIYVTARSRTHTPLSALPLNARVVLVGRVFGPDGVLKALNLTGYKLVKARRGGGFLWVPPGWDGMSLANVVRFQPPGTGSTQYNPGGYYEVYNGAGQVISPYSGQTVAPNDPDYHNPLGAALPWFPEIF